jgi:hypothetical protein
MSNSPKIMPFNLPKNSGTMRNRNRGRRSPSYLHPIPENRPFPNNRIPTNTGVAPRLEEPVSVSKLFSGPGNPVALNAPLYVPNPQPTKPSMFLPNQPPVPKPPSKPRPWNNAQTGNDPNKVYEPMKPKEKSKGWWPFSGGKRSRKTNKSRKSRKTRKSRKSRK